MQHRQIHRLFYRLKNQYFTLNNAVVAVAFIIAAGWVWGSLNVMQRNYTLQQTLSRKNQELQLSTLQTRSLELEQEYYKTREYQELAVRERLGKGQPNEKLLILPKQAAGPAQQSTAGLPRSTVEQPSNLQQWLSFFFSRQT